MPDDIATRIRAVMNNAALTAVINMKVPQPRCRRHTAVEDRRALDHTEKFADSFAEMVVNDARLSVEV